MTINVNNQKQIITSQSSVIQLLETLGVSSRGIAIAINNEVVSKEQWSETYIQEQDQITIIQATQGG